MPAHPLNESPRPIRIEEESVMPYHHKETKYQLSVVLDKLKDAVYVPQADLKVTAWTTREPVTFRQRLSGKKIALLPGQKWGDLFDCAWLHFSGAVPESSR
jgi:alpha-mannosidase